MRVLEPSCVLTKCARQQTNEPGLRLEEWHLGLTVRLAGRTGQIRTNRPRSLHVSTNVALRVRWVSELLS